MNSPLRILFVDDHTLFRESVVRLLEQEPDFNVVADCATLAEAERALIVTDVDLILLDYDLGTDVGTEFFGALGQTEGKVKILMVTGGMDAVATLKVVDAGVSGIVLKHSDPRQLVEAIRRVAAGENWWDTGVLRALGNATGNLTPRSSAQITDRQRQVLHLILDGLTTKEIAATVQSSETAVKASIQELFAKAGVRTRSQLVRIALEKHASDWLR